MKQLLPEKDVLYTFVMPKSGDQKRYEFIGETDKGRYMMRNVDEYCNVDFSQKWFAFLASRCLLHKEPTPKKIKEENNKILEERKRKKEEENNKKLEELHNKIKALVKNADKKTQKELEILTGKTYENILSIMCYENAGGFAWASIFSTIENKYFKEQL